MDWMTIITLVFAGAAILALTAVVWLTSLYLRAINETASVRDTAEARHSKLQERYNEELDHSRELRSALRWYGDQANWQGRDSGHSVAFKDRGKIAREALGIE